MEIWTKEAVEERISLLSRKYYMGYEDPNPEAAIYMFQRKLQEMEENGRNEIEIYSREEEKEMNNN